ncbi:SRPBCC domain-containing protein [Sphingomonas sp. RT2P30]|uniref:SRPBCC domain-containing protein n=1 Tax=Parasphingomonas halimpatiens TaxID=3096162 RepID=UPI002FC5CE7E
MAQTGNEPGTAAGGMTAERISDRETLVTRSFDAPARLLFAAWSKAELFREWWVPQSYGMTLLSCEMDVRVGGGYRLVFKHPESAEPMAFFGRYLDVVPDTRISWTNEESENGAVTTVTFTEQDGRTTVVIHDLYPSKDVLDAEIESGATGGMGETLDQLAAFVATMAAA